MKSTVMDKANQLACTTQCVDSLIAFGQWLKRGLAGFGFAIPPLCVPRATNSKGRLQYTLYVAVLVVCLMKETHRVVFCCTLQYTLYVVHCSTRCMPRATNSKGSCLLYIAIHVVRSEIIYTLKWKLFPIENGNHFVHSRDKVCIINSSRSHLVSIAINCIT